MMFRMAHWTKVAAVEDCPPGNGLEVIVGERVVALFNIEGTFYALDGVCPHQGGPLAEGEVTGCIVTCPWHGWQFDVRTGQHQLSTTIRQPTLPVRIEGDAVLVEFE
jgi:nitrite reductase (NADH) small subunit